MTTKTIKCTHINSGNSPTGWWCNDCGKQDPCPCWISLHEQCIDDMNRIRKDGLVAKQCCCKDQENDHKNL